MNSPYRASVGTPHTGQAYELPIQGKPMNFPYRASLWTPHTGHDQGPFKLMACMGIAACRVLENTLGSGQLNQIVSRFIECDNNFEQDRPMFQVF